MNKNNQNKTCFSEQLQLVKLYFWQLWILNISLLVACGQLSFHIVQGFSSLGFVFILVNNYAESSTQRLVNVRRKGQQEGSSERDWNKAKADDISFVLN